MSNPNHAKRWYNQMMAQWQDQLDCLSMGTRADGTPKATPNGLKWQTMSITSSEVMPFCTLGNRLYMIGLPGFRSFHLQVDSTLYETRANQPLDFGRYSILVFDEKVARIAFPINGRMVYGHRIGELFTDKDGFIWEEVWRKAKAIHEEKETRMHSNSSMGGERMDFYKLSCNMGDVTAQMIYSANNKKKTDKREEWQLKVISIPYTQGADDIEQYHYRYIEIDFTGASIQITDNGELIAESDTDSSRLYLPTDPIHDHDLQLFLTPKESGDIELKSIRFVECVHELVQ